MKLKFIHLGNVFLENKKGTLKCLDRRGDGMLKRLVERWIHIAQIEWSDLVDVVV
ncbi:hypothetical protein EC843_110103 [Buttiauxella sp. JUb87]|jgi:hypothetical protein|nr:hypothetical protein EC843_110103 [Buttiauxella sp. JUb87]